MGATTITLLAVLVAVALALPQQKWQMSPKAVSGSAAVPVAPKPMKNFPEKFDIAAHPVKEVESPMIESSEMEVKPGDARKPDINAFLVYLTGSTTTTTVTTTFFYASSTSVTTVVIG